MAGLAILKHMHELSDEALCDRWVENPCYHLFCGEVFFQHCLTYVCGVRIYIRLSRPYLCVVLYSLQVFRF